MVWAVCILVTGLSVGFLTYPHNKKIGYGAGWQSSGPIIASFLMGLNSAFCCGIIGYIWVQSIAASKMRTFGLKGSSFGGMKKKDIQFAIQELRKQEAMRQNPVGPAPPII
jgi:hypothetical protein